MATTVIEAAKAYSGAVVREPLVNSVYSLLVDPTKVRYSKYGKETLVREIKGGKASNYDKAKGFQSAGSAGSASWVSYTAPYDREMTFVADAMDEYNAIVEGFELSGVAVAKQNMVAMGAEIDATTAAALYSAVPSANVFTSTTMPIDKANVFTTLTAIEAKIFNAGYTGDSFVFARATAYSNIVAALLSNNALANEQVLKYTPVGGMELETRIIKYNNLVIVRVPDNRHYTEVTLLDGLSAGQEDGGYVAGTTAAYIDFLVVPAPAANLSIRHVVANLLVPMAYMEGLNTGSLNIELGGVNELTGNMVSFQNVGVNQKGDGFEYQTRLVYGPIAYNIWKKTLFAVTTAIV